MLRGIILIRSIEVGSRLSGECAYSISVEDVLIPINGECPYSNYISRECAYSISISLELESFGSE